MRGLDAHLLGNFILLFFSFSLRYKDMEKKNPSVIDCCALCDKHIYLT